MSKAKATPSTTQEHYQYDVIIVGAGLSGLLLAAKLAPTVPRARVLVLEKETQVGGRVTGNVPHLQLVSKHLYDFWMQIWGQTVALPSLRQHKHIALVVSTTKAITMARQELFSTETVQQLGNSMLASVWEKFCEAMQDGKLKKTVKNFDPPLSVLLDKLAVLLALPNIAAQRGLYLQQKLAVHSATELISGDWIQALLRLASNVEVKTECQVVAAQHQQALWVLQSAKGTHRGRVLVVAQPPWSASEWLPASHWPASLAGAVRRQKPHSAVCLVSTEVKAMDIPDELCVVAEGAHVLRTTRGELALARVLSYETQLRAPAVTAAVGKLKRALRSLNRIYGTAAEPRLLALIPAAYHLPLGEAHDTTAGLFFCGDSYGKNENGDDNIISTVHNVGEGVVNFLQS